MIQLSLPHPAHERSAAPPSGTSCASRWAASILCAALGACAPGSDEESTFSDNDPPTPVVAVSLQQDSLQDVFLRRQATLLPVSTSIISAHRRGFVYDIIPEVGDMVNEGDLVAVLDKTDAAYEVAALRAEQQNAEATLEEAKRSWDRAKRLHSRDIISIGELDDERASLHRARALVEEARAKTDRVVAGMDAMQITAPVPGIVSRLFAESGEYIARGSRLLEIKRIDVVVALTTVSERDLRDVREGAAALVHVVAYPDQVLEGLVWKIVPDANVESRSFPVKVLLPNPELSLKPGMSGQVAFVRQIDDALLVPNSAVLSRDEDPFVFVVNKNGGSGTAVAERRKVELGETLDQGRHVRSGLAPEDQIIVTGNDDLENGAAIEVVELPPPGPPTLPTARGADSGEPSGS